MSGLAWFKTGNKARIMSGAAAGMTVVSKTAAIRGRYGIGRDSNMGYARMIGRASRAVEFHFTFPRKYDGLDVRRPRCPSPAARSV